MYCRKCGKEILADSNFCNFCGTKIQLQKEDESEKASLTLVHILKTIKDRFPLDDSVLNTELLPISDVKQIRPWIRFWARMIDITVVDRWSGFIISPNVDTRTICYE